MKAIWHDVECGGYAADLPLWEELADEAPGPVLDLGCGTGRVALHLAARGHRVLGLDAEEALVDVLAERARGLPVEAEAGDARDFELGAEFGLVLAPMQLIQLLEGPEQRLRCLACVARHLADGGTAALAIVEPPAPSPSPSSRLVAHSETKRELTGPLPDTREVDGWVYSSLPLDALSDPESIRVRRLRQTVSPDGELREETDEVRLLALDAATLEDEARGAGLRPAGRRTIAATDDHVGSTAVLLRKEAR